MAALVSIGGFDFPEPSSYSATTSTIVDSARNVSGYKNKTLIHRQNHTAVAGNTLHITESFLKSLNVFFWNC